MNWPSFLPQVHIPDWRHGLGLAAAVMLFAWHPFSGGPRVPMLILVSLGVWLWWTASVRLRGDTVQRRWGLVVLCIGLPVLLSLPTSFAPDKTALTALTVVVAALAGSALIEVLRLQGALRLVQWLLAALLVLWLLDALVQMLFGRDLLWIPQHMTDRGLRVVGMYDGHLYLAWVLILILPLLLWSLLPRRPFWALTALLAAGTVIAGTGIRSALLCWILVALFFLVHVPIPRKGFVVLLLACVIAGAVSLSPVARQKFSETRLDQFTFEQIDKMLNSRLVIWEAGWLMFRDRPLTGVGAGAFRTAYADYSYRSSDPFGADSEYGIPHAHQLYVSVLAETGLIGISGLLLVWWLVVRWYYRAHPAARERARPFAVGLIAIAFPVNSQPLIFKIWWLPLLVFVVAGLLVALQAEVQPGRGND